MGKCTRMDAALTTTRLALSQYVRKSNAELNTDLSVCGLIHQCVVNAAVLKLATLSWHRSCAQASRRANGSFPRRVTERQR